MEDWEEFFEEKSRRRAAKERRRQIGTRIVVMLGGLALIVFTALVYLLQ
ncbi:MAG: hypothetical protein ABIW33_06570 [Sphingomicrobium sp.]